MESGNKKVIYTAIFGGYNGLIPQPEITGFDYVCFTDDPKVKASPWKVKVIESPVPEDFTRSNRYFKLLPHKFLAEYEISIYIDGNILILKDLNALVDTYLKEFKMAAFSHEFTVPDNRDCIYKEHKAIINLAKEEGYFRDDPYVMQSFIEKLKSENYPEENGLIKGGVLIRSHNHPLVIKVMEEWWEMVRNYSKRDQLSFNYVAWKNNFKYATIPGDLRRGNPWVYWMGKHRKDWASKLIKMKIKKALGLLKFYSE